MLFSLVLVFGVTQLGPDSSFVSVDLSSGLVRNISSSASFQAFAPYQTATGSSALRAVWKPVIEPDGTYSIAQFEDWKRVRSFRYPANKTIMQMATTLYGARLYCTLMDQEVTPAGSTHFGFFTVPSGEFTSLSLVNATKTTGFHPIGNNIIIDGDSVVGQYADSTSDNFFLFRWTLRGQLSITPWKMFNVGMDHYNSQLYGLFEWYPAAHMKLGRIARTGVVEHVFEFVAPTMTQTLGQLLIDGASGTAYVPGVCPGGSCVVAVDLSSHRVSPARLYHPQHLAPEIIFRF